VGSGATRDVAHPYAPKTSNGIDQDDLAIGERLDLDHLLVADRSAVSRLETHAVDLDAADRWHEIAVAFWSDRVFSRFAGFERGAEHARDLDAADRWHEIAVAFWSDRVFSRFAGFERGA